MQEYTPTTQYIIAECRIYEAVLFSTLKSRMCGIKSLVIYIVNVQKNGIAKQNIAAFLREYKMGIKYNKDKNERKFTGTINSHRRSLLGAKTPTTNIVNRIHINAVSIASTLFGNVFILCY
jgi:glycerol-3-phosphate responsive antiterminator